MWKWKHSFCLTFAAVEFVSKKRKEERGKDDKSKEEKGRDLDRDLVRRVTHIKYLMEKYGARWKGKMSKGEDWL